MKFLCLTAVSMLLAFQFSVAQNAAPVSKEDSLKAVEAANANKPDIVFDSETINYGTIEQGADGQREFTFKNTGKEPLIISTCKGSCGCTVPTCPSAPIMPGETGSIKVKYDTKRLGSFTKTVTVRSNAKTPVKYVKITGKVVSKPGGNTVQPVPPPPAQ